MLSPQESPQSEPALSSPHQPEPAPFQPALSPNPQIPGPNPSLPPSLPLTGLGGCFPLFSSLVLDERERRFRCFVQRRGAFPKREERRRSGDTQHKGKTQATKQQ